MILHHVYTMLQWNKLILAAEDTSPKRQDSRPILGISPNIQIPALYSVQQNIFNRDVNVIIGVTKNKSLLFEPSPLSLNDIAYNISVLDLAILVSNENGCDIEGNYEKIYVEYPCTNCNEIDYANNYAQMKTDFGFKCPARNGSIAINIC